MAIDQLPSVMILEVSSPDQLEVAIFTEYEMVATFHVQDRGRTSNADINKQQLFVLPSETNDSQGRCLLV